jgi:ribonuclease BN (tRNA processing enzyme)
MKLHFLGTCSGTEPMPDMHHQSWVMETNGVNYWFDAGENCAHRAHTSQLDIMNTIAIFVSHPHIDHIGGLANLLTCFHKLIRMYKREFIRNNTLEIFFPDLPLLQYIKEIAYSGRGVKLRYTLNEHPVADGLLFSDKNVRVTALHNRHLKEDGSNGWHAFSFLIEVEGKRVVFSGDVFSTEELLPLIGDGCDVLIMETGHHDVTQVMDFAVAHNIKNLRLTHHGRQIIENRAYYEALAAEYTEKSSTNIALCYDGKVEEF